MLEIRKDFFADERDDNLNVVGKGVQRQDMLGHVTGTTAFFDDHRPAGMLHLKVLRSPHARARIRGIDTSAAERAPGVVRLIRGADVPRNLNTLLGLIGFGKDDEPSLATTQVNYRGEPVLAIVAESERACHEALALVRVDYDPLPAVFDVEEALRPGAPQVNATYPGNAFEYHDAYDHQRIRFGDAEGAFARAHHRLDQRYDFSPIEQAPTETNGSIAAPETNGRFVVYTPTQGLFFSLDTCAKILDLESNRLHFIGGTAGGGFGGKVDSLTEPLAILGAMLTGRPVRYVLGREEEMQFGGPRSGERIYIKDGMDRDGRIIARQITVYFDAGAYTRLTSYGAVKCAAHLPGPYTIPNVRADCYTVFTNRTPSTAMRGFGVTAVDWAIECQMDKLAAMAGIDPAEFRILNAYRDGDMKAHRRLTKGAALIECVQVATEKAGWPLSDAARRDSSRQGGGGARAEITPTPKDTTPKRRNQGAGQAAPFASAYGAPITPATATSPPATPQPSAFQQRFTPPPVAPPAMAQPPAAARPADLPPDQPPAGPTGGGAAGAARRFSSVFGTRRR